MDGSDENGMAIKWRLELKMAERREEQHGNPSSENNSGETAIATARENSKIKIKVSNNLVARWQKATAMRTADRRPSKNVNRSKW